MWFIRLLVLVLAVSSGRSAAASDELVLTISIGAPLSTQNGTGFLDRLGHEMFRGIDRKLKIVTVPGVRGLENLVRGIDDGLLARTSSIEPDYPMAVRVPETMMQLDMVAIGTDGTAERIDWDHLSAFRVAYVRGWKVFEQRATGARSALAVSGPDQLLPLLRADRVDLLLWERFVAMLKIKEERVPNARILEPPLVSSEIFMYLHERHASLTPRLAASLRAMKIDGRYQRLMDDLHLHLRDR